MSYPKLTIVSALLFLLFIFSCKKDKDLDITQDPTPYQVSLPDYVNLYLGSFTNPPDNPLTVEGVALGRKLFYDKRLSNDLTMSCGTCHKQDNGFTDPRNFSQGTNGMFGNRNSMTIINAAWATQFFWDGRQPSLERQAHDPVVNPIEMANTWPVVEQRLRADSDYPSLFQNAFGTPGIDSIRVTKAIAQFQRTLLSFNTRFDKYYFLNDTSVFNDQEKRGLNVYFGQGACNHCHSDVLITDNMFRNNGLDAVPVDSGLFLFTGNNNDVGKFKVPTLRNIEVSAPYMHDSRFSTLEEVVEHYSSGIIASSPNLDIHLVGLSGGVNLTAQQKADLVAFLKTFTDQEFLSNPAFSDPN